MLLSHILPHGITVHFGTTGCITVTIWRTTVHDHIVPTNAYANAHLHGLFHLERRIAGWKHNNNCRIKVGDVRTIVILHKCFSSAKNNIVLISILKLGVSEGMLPQDYIYIFFKLGSGTVSGGF